MSATWMYHVGDNYQTGRVHAVKDVSKDVRLFDPRPLCGNAKVRVMGGTFLSMPENWPVCAKCLRAIADEPDTP